MAKNETIFVNIASYRDPELVPTIKDCLEKAKYPERLRFGICWQHNPEDEWDNLDEFKNDSRFRIDDVHFQEAKGVCWARNRTQKLWVKEKYTLQLDSHHRFIENWDEECIKMYKDSIKAGYPKPLLTSYIPSYDPKNDPDGRVNEPWYLCYDRIAPEGPLHTKPHTMINWREEKTPVPSRFLSAHFIFTDGIFNRDVQYDPSLYFHGEEITMAVRAFSWGYDLLAPHKVVCWHHYGRDFDIKHWSEHEFELRDKVSFQRVRQLLGVGRVKCRPCQLRQLEPYAFGPHRTLKQYEEWAGINFTDVTVQQYTLDHHYPPNPTEFETAKAFSDSFLKHNRFCIDIHKSHFRKDDYAFIVVSFEGEEPDNVISRVDMDPAEFKRLMDEDPNDEFIHVWRSFYGPRPYKYVIWPNSISEGYIDRFEHVYEYN